MNREEFIMRVTNVFTENRWREFILQIMELNIIIHSTAVA